MELHHPSQTRFGSLTGQLFFYEPLATKDWRLITFSGGINASIGLGSAPRDDHA